MCMAWMYLSYCVSFKGSCAARFPAERISPDINKFRAFCDSGPGLAELGFGNKTVKRDAPGALVAIFSRIRVVISVNRSFSGIAWT
ncbi:hypothetical protein BD779DRAFT_1582140 [Infundibulicybe gibba]|nr:hypothetical protein BD779DRAFT_1582140 [Infundibulicybe gibba]